MLCCEIVIDDTDGMLGDLAVIDVYSNKLISVLLSARKSCDFPFLFFQLTMLNSSESAQMGLDFIYKYACVCWIQ